MVLVEDIYLGAEAAWRWCPTLNVLAAAAAAASRPHNERLKQQQQRRSGHVGGRVLYTLAHSLVQLYD
jgi:hypothetical protein